MSENTADLTKYIDENFGANATYVQGLLARFQKDPKSVDESWQTFFGDLLGSNGQGAAEVRVEAKAKPAAVSESKPVVSTVENARPITGPAKKIVENMEQSLTVPTATSVRSMPVKLLEENRRVINEQFQLAHSLPLGFPPLVGLGRSNLKGPQKMSATIHRPT